MYTRKPLGIPCTIVRIFFRVVLVRCPCQCIGDGVSRGMDGCLRRTLLTVLGWGGGRVIGVVDGWMKAVAKW